MRVDDEQSRTSWGARMGGAGLVAIFVLLVGCGDDEAASSTPQPQSDFDCRGGQCTEVCDAPNGCNFTAQAGATLNATCGEGPCRVTCGDEGTRCHVDCGASNDCEVICNGTAECSQECSAADGVCTLDCSMSGSCSQSCEAGRTCAVRCELTEVCEQPDCQAESCTQN